MSDLLTRAAQMQAQTPGLLSVDLCAGFGHADIAEAGPSVQVTYDASHNAAEQAAQQAAATLYAEIHRRRAEVTVEVHDLPTATRLAVDAAADAADRSEEHTSELQSLMRISYAALSLKKKKATTLNTHHTTLENLRIREHS